MKIRDRAVAEFLSETDTVRDGMLVGLSVRRSDGDREMALHLNFEVSKRKQGNKYEVILWEELTFDYIFSSERTLQQIAFVKCLWTDEGSFYLSLDPWKESERFPSEQDSDCFRSKFVKLTIS